jgi:hypothetical protein
VPPLASLPPSLEARQQGVKRGMEGRGALPSIPRLTPSCLPGPLRAFFGCMHIPSRARPRPARALGRGLEAAGFGWPSFTVAWGVGPRADKGHDGPQHAHYLLLVIELCQERPYTWAQGGTGWCVPQKSCCTGRRRERGGGNDRGDSITVATAASVFIAGRQQRLPACCKNTRHGTLLHWKREGYSGR